MRGLSRVLSRTELLARSGAVAKMFGAVMAGSLSFRRAVLADTPDIVALVESAYRGDSSRAGWTTEADLLEGQRTDADEVGSLITRKTGLILLALSGSALMASMALSDLGGGRAYLGMFAVSPSAQGAGLGRAMIEEAESLVKREFQATCLRMTVIAQRTELIAWYERRGFVNTGEREDFPYGDPRFGLPVRDDLYFAVLEKSLR
jgi:ribosomal protein S18 acetylase RimI-like enzyme